MAKSNYEPAVEPNWVSVKEAAEYVSVSEKTIRRWIDRGEIVARRWNTRLIRVDLNTVASLGRDVHAYV